MESIGNNLRCRQSSRSRLQNYRLLRRSPCFDASFEVEQMFTRCAGKAKPQGKVATRLHVPMSGGREFVTSPGSNARIATSVCWCPYRKRSYMTTLQASIQSVSIRCWLTIPAIFSPSILMRPTGRRMLRHLYSHAMSWAYRCIRSFPLGERGARLDILCLRNLRSRCTPLGYGRHQPHLYSYSTT
jgi:hypothetical protein